MTNRYPPDMEDKIYEVWKNYHKYAHAARQFRRPDTGRYISPATVKAIVKRKQAEGYLTKVNELSGSAPKHGLGEQSTKTISTEAAAGHYYSDAMSDHKNRNLFPSFVKLRSSGLALFQCVVEMKLSPEDAKMLEKAYDEIASKGEHESKQNAELHERNQNLIDQINYREAELANKSRTVREKETELKNLNLAKDVMIGNMAQLKEEEEQKIAVLRNMIGGLKQIHKHERMKVDKIKRKRKEQDAKLLEEISKNICVLHIELVAAAFAMTVSNSWNREELKSELFNNQLNQSGAFYFVQKHKQELEITRYYIETFLDLADRKMLSPTGKMSSAVTGTVLPTRPSESDLSKSTQSGGEPLLASKTEGSSYDPLWFTKDVDYDFASGYENKSGTFAGSDESTFVPTSSSCIMRGQCSKPSSPQSSGNG